MSAYCASSKNSSIFRLHSPDFNLRIESFEGFADTCNGAAVAFAGAELVRLQYGNAWGAAAYGTAALVAYLRVFHSEHWMSDVLLGAGIGILSAHLGDLVLSPLKSLFHINTGIYVKMDSVSGAVCPALAFNF